MHSPKERRDSRVDVVVLALGPPAGVFVPVI
jgi:hypothetical protein